MRVFVLIATLVCTSQAGRAEAKTDFSGRWILNKSKSKEANPSMFKGRTMDVSQKGIDLNVDIRDEEPDGSEFRAYLNFKIDGTPTVSILGAPQRAVLRWDGAKLIIRWNLDSPPPGTSSRNRPGQQGATPPFTWTWTRSADGKALINEIHVYEQRGDITERLVYNKAH
jgi:hypothetical protein